MITEVTMPKLGLTMDEGTILSWLKAEGDTVRAGEALLSVETDKVAIDVEAPANGTLLKIRVQEGNTVPLGEVLAYLGDPGEAIPEKMKPAPGFSVAVAAEARQAVNLASPPAGPIKVSPIARKLAEENQIDLSTLQGSGPQGRIVEADIQAILSQREQSAQSKPVLANIPYRLQPLTTVQRVTAQRMSESFRTIPHFYLSIELNITRLVELRQGLLTEYEGRLGIRVTYTDLLLKALALTLPKHPLLNASYHTDADIKVYDEINLGIAIASEHGLVVGVIHSAGRMSLGEIVQARQALTVKAQGRKLMPDDISGGTFTLTNLGMYGVDDFSPIINPGQSAILAAGAILERPVSEDGTLVLRPTLHLTLGVDHRVADGIVGAIFLKDFRTLLESPEGLKG
jgi:pyruvate dehydrogenase E2 component (dihydrolipoamide acetyltransferase)